MDVKGLFIGLSIGFAMVALPAAPEGTSKTGEAKSAATETNKAKKPLAENGRHDKTKDVGSSCSISCPYGKDRITCPSGKSCSCSCRGNYPSCSCH